MATPFAVPRFRFLFAACWLLWMLFHFVVLHWYGYTISIAIIDSLVSNGLLLGGCILISTILSFYLPSQQRYVYVLALCIVLALFWLFASRFIVMLLTNAAGDYKYFFSQSIPVRISIGFLIIGCMSLLSILWYTLQDQQEAGLRRSEAERLTKEAELYKLRQQLQPHFLFNSLNSINALIGIEPAKARTMIQQLSDFLRGTLKKEENTWVSLEDELEHLQLYLDIEKVRFGHRLSAIVTNEEKGKNRQLPVMLLQPIVENAIKFGLYNVLGTVTIRIDAKAESNMLVITVQNPFDPSTTIPYEGTGFGLRSVQRRLYLLFARHDLLQTEWKENVFSTTIKILQPHQEAV